MLPHDFDLTNAHLQALSSREVIVALCAQLGYNTEARLKQTSAALGFSDVLAHEVTHVERVADHENGELQVYLLEMKHVTVALTQALARSLRNRAGNFLLVLTADYERIDFVLMDLVQPEGSGSGIGLKAAFLRPRTLTVERRNPTLVDVRVLRRFSYTESDVYYQLDKIRSAYGVAEWSEPFFNNRALFSDYYLNERLPQLPEWQADAAPAFRALSKLLADAREKYAGKREAELRTQLYQPLFAALGWKAEAQKAGYEDDARADYVLSDANGSRVSCLTYVWDRYLDGPDETRDSETPRENPAQTVVGLLDHGQDGGWAIVTNGKVWRLYSARAHSRATNYYEIDLEETLASPDVDVAFRYFWLFFRAAAVIASASQRSNLPDREGIASSRPSTPLHSAQDAPRNDAAFLDFLLDESASFAKALGERLKDRVFGEVFPYFAEGFIKHGHARPSTTSLRDSAQGAHNEWTDDDLVVAFQATLTFLYRLLFVLYAEARDLLPVRETRGYWEVSLQRIKEEIAAKAGNLEDEVNDRLEKAYSAGETTLYDRLLKLFRVIDRGAAELNVPIYNGGLFQTFDDESLRSVPVGLRAQSATQSQSAGEIASSQTALLAMTDDTRIARFLQSHKIPDRYLALGLDRMARDIDARRGDLVAIDYKSLGVRHLGSIYEGLLEFRLRIAREKMAVVRGKKTDEVVPAREAGDAKIKATLPKGAAYLENDKHERKATGSYYTPDYIVKYIVQHTVGPVLDEKFEALRPRLRQAAKRFDETVKRKQTIEHAAPDRPALLNDLAGDLLRDLFDVKVLDPAMGSGHFLVEAVDFITDRLLRFLYGFPFVNHFFEGQRRLILSALERQGVTVDPARLTDVNLLKRHVLKRCIFGVDLNPMAVELAKVSVWLDCFTLGAPLSFLDHHLKWGNSLIGARVDEVRDAVEFKHAEQLSMFASSQFTGIMLATDLMRHVGELPDTTAEQVAASRAEFRRANDALAPYRRIMDVYVSKWFGNAPTKQQSKFGLDPTIEFLRRDETKAWLNDPKQGVKKLDAALKAVAETAQQAADDKRFLHWELEFPEVFFGPSQGTTQAVGLKEDGGFDAVIGNPPYDEISEYAWGRETAESNYLADQRDYQTALGGRLNLFRFFILRAITLLGQNGSHGFIVPLPLLSDQFSVSVRKLLLSRYQFHEIHCFPQKDDPQNRVFEQAKLSTCVYVVFNTLPHLEFKIHGYPGRYFEAGTSYITTASEVIAVDPENQSIPVVDENAWHLLKKLATGRLNGRFGEAGEVFPGEVMLNAQFAKYILDEPTGKLLLRGAHIGRYEFNDSPKQGIPQYLDADAFLAESGSDTKAQHHKYQRIGFQRGAAIDNWRRLIGTVLEPGCFLTDTVGYILPRQPYLLHFLLALFESRLFEWRFGLYSTTNHVNAYEVKSLPLRRIAFITPEKHHTALVAQVKDMSSRQDQAGLLAFVEQRLTAQSEESDVVHDVLAFLAGQMIDLNKQKQAEMKRLLTWLESALKISPDKNGNTGLDVLTGKSRLRNYLGDYQKGEGELAFEDVIDILHKNRTKIGISLSEARLMARLRAEYEKSVETLKPLKAQLAWTDGVIDQIVYRLYGLTTEEIRVVEGKG